MSNLDNVGLVSTNEWSEYWDSLTEQPPFHLGKPHEELVQYFGNMSLPPKTKVFLPLCGKAEDIKWLYDKGCTVYGIDCSRKAIKEFGIEHDILWRESDVKNSEFTAFRNDDGRIQILCGDFFNLNSEILPKFNLVFDKGSLSAINFIDRQRYVQILRNFIHNNSKWFLMTVDFDPEKYKGPPHYVSQAEIEFLFGDNFDIKLLKEVDCLGDRQREWGLNWMIQRSHLLTLKF